MTEHTPSEYKLWLQRLRNGHDAFIAEQELGTSEADRRVVALNIQEAYLRLSSGGSPFKDQLTDDDRHTVAIADALLEKMPERKPS